MWVLYRTKPATLTKFILPENIGKIFPHSLTIERHMFFTNDAEYAASIRKLPDTFRDRLGPMNYIRIVLNKFYEARGPGKAEFRGVHDQAITKFDAAVDIVANAQAAGEKLVETSSYLPGDDLRLVWADEAEDQRRKKRNLDDEADKTNRNAKMARRED